MRVGLDALFRELPLDAAMPDLLPRSAKADVTAKAAAAAADATPAIQAAIWLYIDDLERSHTVSQGISGPVGAFWHGIMHRREGDFWNAKYWLRQARSVWSDSQFVAELGGSFDPCAFVDFVEQAGGANPAELVDLQRKEWLALFSYCSRSEGE